MAADVRELNVPGAVSAVRGLGVPVYPQDVRPGTLGQNLQRLVEQLDPQGTGAAGKFVKEQQAEVTERIAINERMGTNLEDLPAAYRVIVGGAYIHEEADKLRGRNAANAAFTQTHLDLINSEVAKADPSEQRDFLDKKMREAMEGAGLTTEAGQLSYADVATKQILGSEDNILARYAKASREKITNEAAAGLRGALVAGIENPEEHPNFPEEQDAAFAQAKADLLTHGFTDEEADKVLLDTTKGIAFERRGDGGLVRGLMTSGVLTSQAGKDAAGQLARSLDIKESEDESRSYEREKRAQKQYVDSVLGKMLREADGDPAVLADMSLPEDAPDEVLEALTTSRSTLINHLQNTRDALKSTPYMDRIREGAYYGDYDETSPEVRNLPWEQQKLVFSDIQAGREVLAETLRRPDVAVFDDVFDFFESAYKATGDLAQASNVAAARTAALREFAESRRDKDFAVKAPALLQELVEKHLGAIVPNITVHPALSKPAAGSDRQARENAPYAAQSSENPERSPYPSGPLASATGASQPGPIGPDVKDTPSPIQDRPYGLSYDSGQGRPRPAAPALPNTPAPVGIAAPNTSVLPEGSAERAGAALAGIQAEEALRAGPRREYKKGDEVGLARLEDKRRRAQQAGLIGKRSPYAAEAWASPSQPPILPQE